MRYSKKRHDVLPNLVETVKSHAMRGQEPLEQMTATRNLAAQPGAGSPQQKQPQQAVGRRQSPQDKLNRSGVFSSNSSSSFMSPRRSI